MVGSGPLPLVRGYSAYRSACPMDGSHSGGCAVYCRADVPVTRFAVRSDLQVLAVQMHFVRCYTICCLYLPPSLSVDRGVVEDLLSQLPTPYILLGDLNGRHPVWGDSFSNPRGELLVSLVLDLDLVVLNDGRPTHFHVQNGTFSVLDLTVASPDCALDFTWEVLDDLHGSDHYPILLKSDQFVPASRVPRWCMDGADWCLFSELCVFDCTAWHFSTIDDAVHCFTDTLFNAGVCSISRSSGEYSRRPVPWWNRACSLAKGVYKAAARWYYVNRRVTFLKVQFRRARGGS